MTDQAPSDVEPASVRPPFPKLDLLWSMQQDVRDLMTSRERAIIEHRSRDIRAAGNEVEIPVRELLSRHLPAKFGVQHGHIVNPILATTPQLDAIVTDASRFRPLFTGKDGTDWIPFESVLAFGEIKSSYKKSKRYIEAFSDTIKRTKTGFGFPRVNVGGNDGEASTFVQLFTFMIFVNSGDFDPGDIQPFYLSTPAADLPNIVYFVDRGLLFSAKTSRRPTRHIMALNQYPEIADRVGLAYDSRWCFREFAAEDPQTGLGAALLVFVQLLTAHLHAIPEARTSMESYYSIAEAQRSTPLNYWVFEDAEKADATNVEASGTSE
jgi:hypothetical protein